MLVFSIILIIFELSYINSSCEAGVNHCLKCNPVTKLCYKCDINIYAPDENGECQFIKKCKLGENYCIECEEETNLCQKCFDEYYPDEYGGCSYTDNCEISYKGNCLKCKQNYILIGNANKVDQGIRICKSVNSDELINCEKLDTENGQCQKCQLGYYLSLGDHKCILVDNCYESSFGICKKCNNNYYLDKKENKCIKQDEKFDHCKQTLDGEICYECDDDYYFDNEGNCVDVNFCDKRQGNNKCENCISGYYLSDGGKSCTKTQNCKNGDKEFGICYDCLDNYYFDYKNENCKSNQEENEFKFCKFADNNQCNTCIEGYYLGEDYKCSNTKNCSESNNGTCLICIDNNYLTSENKCSSVEHCNIFNEKDDYCKECDENYYYNFKTRKCLIAEGIFENCKFSINKCVICNNNYYLNQTDSLCYDNTINNNFFKCLLTNANADSCISCAVGYYLNQENKICTPYNS